MRHLFVVNHILFITLSCFAQMTFPSDITKIDDFQFENKSISGEIIIPDTVISIGESSFARNEINSVRLPTSISDISKLAFAYNRITKLSLPSNLVSIERFAFYSNELTTVELPQGLLFINDSAFARNNISAIILPETLKVIGRSAFYGNQIVNINIPQSVHTIDSFAFFGNNIENVVITSSISSLENSAFANNQISNLLLKDGIKYIRNRCFAENKIANIEIPRSVRSIGEFAFQNNRITSICIPNNCIVELGVFDGNRITSIIIEGSDIRYEASGVDENDKKYITFGDYGITFNDFFIKNKKRAGIYTYDIGDGWSFQYLNTNLPFSEVLKKNIWNILGSTIGMFGLIIGIIALVNRKIRKPVYSKSDEYDIVDRIIDENNSLKLFWNDDVINNVRVVKISFWNRGKKIIRKDDISDTEPIEIFCINDNIKILRYFISKISRDSIQLDIVNDKNHLKININNNEALEYHDGFEITIYYTKVNDGINDDWKIKGRIHEVKLIKDIGKISIMRKTINNLFYILPFYLILFLASLGAYLLLDNLGVANKIRIFIVIPILFINMLIYSIPKKHDRTYKIPKWNRNNQ